MSDQDIAALQQQAASLGIEVDGRWSAATLIEKIDEASAAQGVQVQEPAQTQPEPQADDEGGIMFKRFGLRPGDPVPFHVCNILARERSRDMHMHAAKFAAQVGKQAREGMLQAAGVVAPTSTIKRPEQRRVEPNKEGDGGQE